MLSSWGQLALPTVTAHHNKRLVRDDAVSVGQDSHPARNYGDLHHRARTRALALRFVLPRHEVVGRAVRAEHLYDGLQDGSLLLNVSRIRRALHDDRRCRRSKFIYSRRRRLSRLLIEATCRTDGLGVGVQVDI